ncbi:HAD-IIIC family phosphatase [Methylobacterium currus]|uniref:HAD-IIIC family phosphatase n=1 Tax=Methylobacterium currus TaxID=2051553 RepID=UPI001E3D4AF0|nr:HAD-IIIC family phosphatase [Methylobacterium currus]UHC14199.1 HAD-IIIC family phosphatase [Methylobacterium currus]
MSSLSTDVQLHSPINPEATFLAPRDLGVSGAPKINALLIGWCVFNRWRDVIEEKFPHVQIEHDLLNNAAELQARDCSSLDLQIVSVPLRLVMPESMYMRLDYADTEAYNNLFANVCNRIDFTLRTMMAHNLRENITTFVTNFFTPIANPLGRLLPRYDLRNPVYLVEQLNQHLATAVSQYTSSHILDLNQISAAHGKRFIQDDSVSAIAHNSLMVDHGATWDAQRLEPPVRGLQETYNIKEKDFIIAAWEEVLAMHRTIKGDDAVKIVIMDLDDTLWRGISGETGGVDQMEQVEGWPLGIVEALTFLKKRGVMVAISSKNEESFIRENWPYEGRFNLSDFAFIRINWKPKAENVADIIKIANVSPSSVVFVDDNPVERRAVATGNPGVRTIGADPYIIRRLLLWSSETQVPFITDESRRRTEMMQAQERRETNRAALSRDEFLASQDIRLRFWQIETNSANFPRAFELLNKTNQFNTTGKRWSDADLRAALARDTAMFAFHVIDKFTDYGLVGVILVSGAHIRQFTMSCRVLGMDVEIAALALLEEIISSCGGASATASLQHTDKNFPCRDLYKRAGYFLDGDIWKKDIGAEASTRPVHITVIHN